MIVPYPTNHYPTDEALEYQAAHARLYKTHGEVIDIFPYQMRKLCKAIIDAME